MSYLCSLKLKGHGTQDYWKEERTGTTQFGFEFGQGRVGGCLWTQTHRQDLSCQGVFNICEMKYSSFEYEITPKYNRELRERVSTFRNVTKTRNDLHLTMITPWGVKMNANSGVVTQNVMLEHLFR